MASTGAFANKSTSEKRKFNVNNHCISGDASSITTAVKFFFSKCTITKINPTKIYFSNRTSTFC